MKAVFPEEMERVEKGLCPLCGREIKEGEFKDELSKKEFKISGMCQKCQDEIFK
jgi:hypothetical protein